MTSPTEPAVNTLRPRWVLAVKDTTPLTQRYISYADTEAVVQEQKQNYPDPARYEIIRVTGRDALNFPLENEEPTYWNVLHPEDVLLGELAPHIELYRRGQDLLVVDDTGAGSPELVGTLPASLPPEPEIPEWEDNDPRWPDNIQEYEDWEQAITSSSLALTLREMGAIEGWRFINALSSGGFDPHNESSPLHWIAITATELRDA